MHLFWVKIICFLGKRIESKEILRNGGICKFDIQKNSMQRPINGDFAKMKYCKYMSYTSMNFMK
jgi:hypothetical protein